MDPYLAFEKHLVAVDCIIFGFEKDKLKLLLIKRDLEPEKGQWSLMGGFVRNSEGIDEAAHRILNHLTGLRDVFLEQLHTFGDVNRDPTSRTISVAYYALISIEDHNLEITSEHHAEWIDLDKVPQLIFDHQRMVNMACERLKYKASHYPVGFELLPDKFTMPELQSLYEAIFQVSIDKRNFIRKIASLDILVKLNEKKASAGVKKAFLYQFDPDKYQEQLQTGTKFMVKP